MNIYYLDASALVKRYLDEIGSDWLRTTIAPARQPLLFTSRMVIVEVISAFARRVREGSLTSEEFVAARDAFRGDCLNDYQIMPPTVTVIDLACTLLEQHPLRAYDATHLATALGAQRFLVAEPSCPHVSLRRRPPERCSLRRGPGSGQSQSPSLKRKHNQG